MIQSSFFMKTVVVWLYVLVKMYHWNATKTAIEIEILDEINYVTLNFLTVTKNLNNVNDIFKLNKS